jgi:hypothetical protein
MATSNIKQEDDEHDQWQTAQTIHNQHQWNDLEDDDDDDIDNHEFFDAHDTDIHHNPLTSTEVNPEAELLHKRLNAQLSTNEENIKKKSPG